MSDENVALMNAKELEHYIALREQKHKRTMAALRALLRVRVAEEKSDGENN